MNEKIIELTSELIGHESENPPGNEHDVADYLETRLQSSPVPFDIESYEVLPGRPNVVARAGDPSNGTVLLAGHTDVVPAHAADWSADPYEPTVHDDRLIGRGAADMKGGLAAKIIATEAYYKMTDEPGQVILACVVDEEANGAGMRTLVERGIDADAAIISEPTDLHVCAAQKGVARYKVAVRGESGHSGRPDDAINAITGLNRVIESIEAFDDHLRKEERHPLLAPETITVIEIAGGIAPNNDSPDRIRMTFDSFEGRIATFNSHCCFDGFAWRRFVVWRSMLTVAEPIPILDKKRLTLCYSFPITLSVPCIGGFWYPSMIGQQYSWSIDVVIPRTGELCPHSNEQSQSIVVNPPSEERFGEVIEDQADTDANEICGEIPDVQPYIEHEEDNKTDDNAPKTVNIRLASTPEERTVAVITECPVVVYGKHQKDRAFFSDGGAEEC